MGNLNARTVQILENLSDEFLNPDLSLSNYYHLPKCASLDKSTNNYGQKHIELCRNFNLAIVSIREGPDKNTEMLTWTNSSIVDFFILSEEVEGFDVLEFK